MPLGAGWYLLGSVTLPTGDTSSALTVAYTGSGSGPQKVGILQRSATNDYDAFGNVVSTTDALGNTTDYSFDSLGRPVQQQAASWDPLLGPVYDKDGNVVSDTDLLGHVTVYKYDAQNRLVEMDQPNATTGQTLNGSGQPVGPVTTYSYDADGDLLSVTDPLHNVTTYSYDYLGRKTSETAPNPTTGAAAGSTLTTTYTYDLDGDLLSETDPLGHTTSYSYDHLGELSSETDPDGGVTSYGYDLMGDETSLTDPDDNVTTWTYDGLGRVKTDSEVVATGLDGNGNPITTTATDTYHYDLDGNLIDSTDADGRVTDYAYNSQDQETGETWYASTASTTPTETLSFAYDARGEMTSASDAAAATQNAPAFTSSYAYQYDDVGNVTGQVMQFTGVAPDVVLTAGYDFNGDRTSLSANIGGTLQSDGTVSGGTPDLVNQYHYDALGNMTSVTQSGQWNGNGVTAKEAAFGYDADSRLTSVTLYQGSNQSNEVACGTYTYNHDSQLTDLNYVDASQSALAGYHWDYDAAGDVSDCYSRNDTAGTPGSSYTAWACATYNYDPDGQLASTTSGSTTTDAVTYSANWQNAPQAGSTPGTEDYGYDANGNRNTSGCVPGAGNRLLSDGTYTYTYDAAGNRTSRTAIDTSATTDYKTLYTWDNRNRLTSVTIFNTAAEYNANTPSDVVTYRYDAFNRLVDESATGAAEEHYVYDGQNLLLVLNNSGSVVERELNGPAVDQVLATEYGPAAAGGQTPGTVDWFLADNQGSVRNVAQYASGVTSIVDHLVYSAYGVLASQTNAAVQPRFGYTGQMLDAATGLYYYRARWYDAATGNFISQDPLAFTAGDTNLTRYCGNGPTNAVDPTGEFFGMLGGGAVGGILGLAGYAAWWAVTGQGSWAGMAGAGAGGFVAGAIVGSMLDPASAVAMASAGVLIEGSAAVGVTSSVAGAATAYGVESILPGPNPQPPNWQQVSEYGAVSGIATGGISYGVGMMASWLSGGGFTPVRTPEVPSPGSLAEAELQMEVWLEKMKVAANAQDPDSWGTALENYNYWLQMAVTRGRRTQL